MIIQMLFGFINLVFNIERENLQNIYITPGENKGGKGLVTIQLQNKLAICRGFPLLANLVLSKWHPWEPRRKCGIKSQQCTPFDYTKVDC